MRWLAGVVVLVACAHPLAAIGDEAPMHAWGAGGVPATGDVVKLDSPTGLDFGGTGHVLLAPKGRPIRLPREALTAEAWVAVREAGEWGGFIGYIQDNGGFEKGFVLGNRQSRFSMALSTSGADDGDGALTYLPADRDIPLRKWCHVVGTYDGALLRIYVNGEKAGETDAQSGAILYADSELVVGAYKDDDEFFQLDGAVHSVAIFDEALPAEAIAARYEAGREQFADVGLAPAPGDVPEPILIDGPYATFEDQSDAIVRWTTREPVKCAIEYRAGLESIALSQREVKPRREHAMRLADIERDTAYIYRIRIGDSKTTDEYVLNTEFDFSAAPMAGDPQPYGSDGRAARRILKSSGIDRGYCLDIGCGDGRLAFEIAKQSRLQVVGVSTDRDAIGRGRKTLLESGNYGGRVTLRWVESLDDLPFPDLCANLIVSGESLAARRVVAPVEEVEAKLRPDGGVALLGPADGRWVEIRKPDPLEGAGEWTHAYGTAGQTANSGDELLRGAAGDTLEVQWFGLPGPNAIIDRQVRMQGPVSAAGRIYTQGNNRIIAQDAYNGAILWSMEIPHLRRTNIPRNTGNACCDRENLYVAVRDRCWVLDGATGARIASHPASGDASDARFDWGYVGIQAGVLLGSAVRRGSMEDGYVGPQKWFDAHSGSDTHNVCSDALFADDAATGRRLWTYSGGPIVNPTISVSDGRIVFIETRSDVAIESPSRQIGPELWSDAWLVVLDPDSGEAVWERRIDVERPPIVAYTVAHDGLACVVLSSGGEYDVRMVSLDDGSPAWQATHPWRSDNHGHHIQHPVVAQERLFLEPVVYEWRTGEAVELTFPSRSKCGTISGAANLLHYRDYNDEVWDLETDTQSEFTRLRSNCWVGMISGSGLLMSPESGGGCGCDWPIYTSLTYRSKDDY